MNPNQDTPTGQVNSTQSAENSNSVGSTFAAVNPPMSAKALAISLAEVPRPWHRAAEQKLDGSPTFSPSLMDELTTGHVCTGVSQPWRDLPICGVVTINNQDWSPKSARSVPPSLTNKLGMFMSAQWAMLFNGSSLARRRHHWAVISTRGTCIILTGIRLEDRPVNPADFPPCVIGGLTSLVVEQAMIDANTPRCKFAHVPKSWTVALRRADSVEMEPEVAL